MKNKKLLSLAVAFATLGSVVGCGGTNNSNQTEEPGTILVWVGAESVDFYTKKLTEYKTNNPSFIHNFEVKAADTGKAADTFLADTAAGADIFTIPHDNIGKLINGTPVIAPISDSSLLTQINNDNPDVFKKVIKGTVQGNEYTFAVPYISQSLVLYYDSSKVTAEQAKSWEGLREAAIAASTDTKAVKATTLAGTDMYNFSWPLLSTEVATGNTTVELYKDAKAENCNVDGDDTVAIMKWTQEYYADANGGKYPGSTGWEVEASQGNVLSVISGAWHLNAAKAAFGEENLGVALLPTFTITETSAYGSVAAGTTFQAGTFADCKAFVMKNGSKYGAYLNDIVKFLTSKSVQEQSFNECANLPAYKNAASEFAGMNGDTLEAKLAKTQIEMFNHGIAQPFGYHMDFNKNFYSDSVTNNYNFIITNDDNSMSSLDEIKTALTGIETYLKTGK